MMKLTITDHTTMLFHLALGITDERRTELCKGLDDIFKPLQKAGKMDIPSAMGGVAQLCSSREELVFCAYTNAEWVAKQKQSASFEFDKPFEISRVRREELLVAVDAIFAKVRGIPVTVSKLICEIAEVCNSTNELVMTVWLTSYWAASSGAVKILDYKTKKWY